MYFGKLTEISTLLSVAKYHSLSAKDENWEVFSSRYSIIDGQYTIDIDSFQKGQEIQFLIFNPNQEGCGTYSLTQKVVKMKN
jgi:hypothetical protein